MTDMTHAKPIVTPMPASPDPDAAAAAAAAGPGSPEAEALAAAQAAAAAKVTDDKEGDAPKTDATKADADATDADAALSLDADEGPIEVESTGNDAFDAVSKILADKGVTQTNAIMESFLETGEVSLEHKAIMIEALGEPVAEMAFKQLESAATKLINEAKADSRKSMDYANDKFGGEDAELTWKQIGEYVRSKESGFSEADLATMNSMLAQGGLQAQLVIDKVHAVYTADKNVSVPGTLLEGDAGITGGTFEPISRIDYTTEMGKAVSKFGEDSPQVQELNRRRTLTMRTGS